ncbi:Cof-type HAD-IIB family hydrolase [Paenibacillus flagellatus]|nr:Cof-type HAD-IIB family hydrolase [Paenibacillus flagellatus]
MKWAAIALDLDGTLLDSGKRVSERSLNALLACRERGVRLIVATARPPRTVARFLPETLLRECSFAYYNGALAVCRDEPAISFAERIPAPLSAEAIDFCLRRWPDAHLTMEADDEWFALGEADYASAMNVVDGPTVIPLAEMKSRDATKLLLSGSFDAAAIADRFRGRLNVVVTDGGRLVQIMSPRASKEAAVAKLCAKYGFTLADVVAFGDDFNDAGLLRDCGHGVAMGNAEEELKRLADEVAEHHDRDGVALVLERLLREDGAGTALA